ncbi:MAG TPA: (d)CMP kinase [Gemmatimonadaceae bacterium]|nr:(d)CMP kinase [Gemmatimonadaceae bacterium]
MTALSTRFVIAIDGPAASGKSSTAQWVAEQIGFHHVDSGALYRAATAAAIEVEPNAERWTEALVMEQTGSITLAPSRTSFLPMIGGQEASAVIRSTAVTRSVSLVAQMPAVRAWVNSHLHAVSQIHDIVVDGRDMGTVVFPTAALKIFLIADPWERARRRLVQSLSRRPTDAEIAEETDALVRRDARDAMQTVQAKDAILIDTTTLTQSEQVARIVALAEAAIDRLRS